MSFQEIALKWKIITEAIKCLCGSTSSLSSIGLVKATTSPWGTITSKKKATSTTMVTLPTLLFHLNYWCIYVITGSVREQTNQKPPFIQVATPPTTVRPPPATTAPTPPPPKSDTALQATTTECPPNVTTTASINRNNNNLLRKLASSHYQSYTTALTITIAVGCFLLLLNILIFAGIYHQRDRGKNDKKKKEELAEAGSCSSSSGEAYDGKSFESSRMNYEACRASYEMAKAECKSMANYIGEYSCEKKGLENVQLTELPLQEFSSSPHSAMKRAENSRSFQPPDVTSTTGQENRMVTSPSIPEPPPPPKNQPPVASVCNQTGILRPQGVPTTPGTAKKRVQIQEISVWLIFYTGGEKLLINESAIKCTLIKVSRYQRK